MNAAPFWKQALASALVRSRRKHPATPAALEVLHRSDQPGFNDSSYLFGRGEDGTALVTRLSVRTDAPSEVWLSVRIPGRPIAHMPVQDHPQEGGWRAGGLEWTVADPGRTLHVRYAGPLLSAGVSIDSVVDLTFEGNGPLIDFSDGVDPAVTAQAIAARPWNRGFFDKLGEIRTVHYEQVGRVRGTVQLDGETHPVDLRSVRDHSFGRRQWNTWRQHLWFSGVREDGVAFTAACIRYGFIGPLTAGFYIDGEPQAVSAVTDFDAIAPPGVVPDRFPFEITCTDGTRHVVDVEVEGVFAFDMDQGAYCIREAIARSTVDGVPAVGICEFGWNPAHG